MPTINTLTIKDILNAMKASVHQRITAVDLTLVSVTNDTVVVMLNKNYEFIKHVALARYTITNEYGILKVTTSILGRAPARATGQQNANTNCTPHSRSKRRLNKK